MSTLWVYLSASPLLWLCLTLGVYLAALKTQQRCGGTPWLNPVLLAVLMLVALLQASGTPYERYFEGAQFVHFLLGTATVALAVPLRRHWAQLRPQLGAAALGLLVGNGLGALLAVLLVRVAGAPAVVQASVAPRGVTAPVAMALAERIGGLPSLTAVLVIGSGILGATLASPWLNALGVRDPAARGLAIGCAAHGIGTARAFQEQALTGTFAGAAMAASALISSLWVPRRGGPAGRDRRGGSGPGRVLAAGCWPRDARAPVELDALEQRLEVAFAEALVALALDDLEEDRPDHRLREDLQQQARCAGGRAVDQDAVRAAGDVLAVAGQALVDQVVIGLDGVLEAHAGVLHALHGA
jgi:predicted murein hydrolase (TIGR00659 family)